MILEAAVTQTRSHMTPTMFDAYKANIPRINYRSRNFNLLIITFADLE